MKQKIILTALPNGLVKKVGIANTVNASVALSLQVEDVDTTLQNVPDMLSWAEKIKSGKFIVYVNGTAVQAKVVSKEVDVAGRSERQADSFLSRKTHHQFCKRYYCINGQPICRRSSRQ